MDSLVQATIRSVPIIRPRTAISRIMFCNDWPDLLYNDYNHYVYVLGCVNEEQSDLTGIKYVLTKTADAGIPGFETYKQFGSVTLYRNTSVTNIASFYDEARFRRLTERTVTVIRRQLQWPFRKGTKKQPFLFKDSVKDDRIEERCRHLQDGYSFGDPI